MTKEQREVLQPYETRLDLLLKADFCRFSQLELDRIFAIYKEMYGTAITKSQMNCSSCKLRALKRIATDYFSSKTVGRPKKIDLEEKKTVKTKNNNNKGKDKK